MREVAALAGVSLKTVSRVVNAEPGVSAARVERVLQAVQRLGYRHNTTASSLRRADRRSDTVGLLLEDVANPFSSTIHRAIEDVARARGTLVFAGSSDGDVQREAEFVHALVSRQVDGLIVVPASSDHVTLLRERQLGMPIVFVDRLPNSEAVDSVTTDNRAGARLAIDHLAEQGHRRIAFLGDLRSIWTAEERYLGYLEGLATHGIRLEDRLVRRDLRSIAAGYRAALDVLAGQPPPSAFFASQNLLTIGVVRALQERKLQHRLALVGFDDFLLADLLDPPVTVISQDPVALGRTAATVLFSRLDGDATPARHICVPTRLVVRGSGEIR